MPWYALYTKPRNEKKVAESLSRRGVEVYCPLQEEVHQWSDRKKKVKVPVFRSYVFVRLADYEQEHIGVLQTAGAVRFVWWLGKPGVVRDGEISNIKDFLEEYKEAKIETVFAPGQRVAVTGGALNGQEGIIVEIGKKKATLRIVSLGLQLTAQLPVGALTRK